MIAANQSGPVPGARVGSTTFEAQGLCGETNICITLERRKERMDAGRQQQISIIGMMWFGNYEGRCVLRLFDLSCVFPKSK